MHDSNLDDEKYHFEPDQFARAVAEELLACLRSCGSGVEEGKAKVLMALSGGPDSTALVLALCRAKSAFPFDLSIAHVNHKLRGSQSDEDEQFARELAEKLSLPFFSDSIQASSSSEAALREARYDALLAIADRCGARFIATGHTLDDQAETILFRILRGTSLTGFKGMQKARLLARGRYLVRPLLECKRKDCLALLENEGVTPRHDASNDDTRYARNYIRLVLMPKMEARFTGFSGRLDNFRQVVADEDDLLQSIADEKWQEINGSASGSACRWSVPLLLSCHPAIQRRLIAKALADRDIEVTFPRLNKILDMLKASGGGKTANTLSLSLNASFDVRIDGSDLVFVDKNPSGKDRSRFPAVTLNVPGLTLVAPLNLSVKVDRWAYDQDRLGKGDFPRASDMEAIVDLGKVEMPLVVRLRQPGDMIQPLGMSEMVRLKKYIHTHKTREAEDEEQPYVLIADQKEVVWVPGVGLSEKIKVGGKPSHRISLMPLASDTQTLA